MLKFVVDSVLDPVRYHPEFPPEQSECKQPDLQHVHLFQHKSTSVVYIPISMSSWIFIFSVAENLDFTSPSECVRNVISCNSHCSCSGEEARWKNPASQIYQFYFLSFYHGWIYNLSYGKRSQNPFPAIIAMS